MSVYTEMEESIMDCWTVVEDLKAMALSGEVPPALLLAFAEVYSFKFSRLADLHEDALKEYYTLKGDSPIEDVLEEGRDLAW